MNNENITARIEAYVGLVNDLIVIEEASIGATDFLSYIRQPSSGLGKSTRKSSPLN